jgi:hypothetical protein
VEDDDNKPQVADDLEAIDRTATAVGDKKFQKQVKKIKILKGLGVLCPAPCKKEDGFLSIESANGVSHIVFRNLTGKVLFSGVLNKSAAKIKVIAE